MGAPRDYGLLSPAEKALVLANMPDKVNARGYLLNSNGDHLPIPADYNSSNILPMLEVLALPIGGAIAAGYMTAAGAIGPQVATDTASATAVAPAATAADAAATTTAAYGPAAGGYAASTTAATVPASLAAPAATTASVAAPAAAATSSSLIPTAIGVGGQIIGSLINANAQGNATAAQQKYLEEALAYEKQRDAAAIALEGQRYQNYSTNIAPYLANGNSAGARMAGLLGLPAPPPVTTSSAPPYTATSPTTTQSPPTLPSPATPASAPAPGGMVTMKAPDGTTQAVNPADVQHYVSLGATVVQ
jgi:hypothetical protein